VIWDGRSPDEFAFKLDKSDKKAYNQRQMVIIRNKHGTELRGYPEGLRMKETGVVLAIPGVPPWIASSSTWSCGRVWKKRSR
jgi:hypothetical protein